MTYRLHTLQSSHVWGRNVSEHVPGQIPLQTDCSLLLPVAYKETPRRPVAITVFGSVRLYTYMSSCHMPVTHAASCHYDMSGNGEYVERLVTDSRQGVVLQDFLTMREASFVQLVSGRNKRFCTL